MQRKRRTIARNRLHECGLRSPIHLAILPVLVLLSLANNATASASDLDRMVAFRINAPNLGQALLQFGAQAHVQIVFAGSVATRPNRTEVLQRRCTERQALTELLRGLELDFIEDGNTVEIVPKQVASSTGVKTLTQFLPAGDPPSQTAQKQNSRATSQSGTDNGRAELRTVVVTGTHLKTPDPTQPVIVLTREDIERDGYTTTGQLFRALPEVFGGGQSGATPDGVYGIGSHADLNFDGATGVDLFGLGAGSTLVLVDGRRLTPSIYGQFADVSLIPITAIERIDIITDGSSAIYGADAVAGVVNIILRHDYRGAQTSVVTGGTTAGGGDQVTVSQSGGTEWRTGSASGSIEYSRQGAVTAAERKGIAGSVLSPSDLYPSSTMYSGTLHGEQTVLDKLQLSLDGLATEKETFRSENTSVSGLSTFSEIVHDVGITVGADYSFTPRWSISASVQFGRDEVENDNGFLAYPTMGPATEMENYALTELSPDVLVRGALFELPGGAAEAAIGASYRTDRFEDGEVTLSSGASATGFFGPYVRHVRSAYAEVELPVVGPANDVPAVRAFDLSLAIRRDAYSDVGTTTNPRFGVRWSPASGFSLRSSWGTSFTPPSQVDSIGGAEQTFVQIAPITAPSGIGTVPTYVTFGGSETLKPQRAHTLDVGADLHLPAAGLKASLDYLDVVYKGRIITPPFVLYALTDPNTYRPFITSLANNAASAAYLNAAIARGWIVQDFIGNGANGVQYVYDLRQRNAQKYVDKAFQLNLSDTRPIGSSLLHASLQALIMDELQASYGEGTAADDLLNTFGYPAKRRVRFQLALERSSWTIGGAINYTGSYSDNEITPALPIASWTTVDLHLEYRTGDRLKTARLNGIRLDLNVINAFDRSPPFVVRAIPADNVNYDVANANPLGRMVSIGISKQW